MATQSKTRSTPKPSAELAPNTVRLIVDPDSDETLVEIQWRWTAEPDDHETTRPQAEQDAESLRAFVLAMLAARLFLDCPDLVEGLGTMKAEMQRGWWRLEPRPVGDTFLKTLANARDRAGSGDKKQRGPFGALLQALPKFDTWWETSRAKGKDKRPCLRTKNPNAGGSSLRPDLLFRLGDQAEDINDPEALLKLAQDLEARMEGAWVPLFTQLKVPPPPPPPEVLPYLNYVEQRCRFVPLRGVQKDDRLDHGDPRRATEDPDERIELERVFVHLNTTFAPSDELGTKRPRVNFSSGDLVIDEPGPLRPDQENPPWPALVAVAQSANRHVVLYGGPGCGKSTFIRFLMLGLAHCGQGRHPEWWPRIEGWPQEEATLIPIRLELRLFAAWLTQTHRTDAKACHLWDYFQAEFENLRKDNSWLDFWPTLEQSVRQGRAVFFLDGLDEVPTMTGKIFIRDCVEKFTQSGVGAACRVVVTCRTRAYDAHLKNGGTIHLRRPVPPEAHARPPKSRHEDWPAYELSGLSTPQQQSFVEKWYVALGEIDEDLKRVGGERAAALCAVLVDEDKPEIGELAKTPLLLTVMAHLHSTQRELKLPDSRAELLDDFVDLLLSRWAERHRSGAPTSPATEKAETLGDLLEDPGLAGVTPKRFLQKLARVAFECFKSGNKDTTPLISEHQLVKALKELHQDEDTPKGAEWAARVLLYIQHRAGLLNSPDGENYDFSHRHIWEYLFSLPPGACRNQRGNCGTGLG